MKITAIKTLVVNAEMRNWVFVKVETDQAGLWGWGEASLEWKTRAVVGAVEDLSRSGDGRRSHAHRILVPETLPRVFLAAGRDRHERRERHRTGLLGYRRQVLGLPVYKLLGGAVRERVRMYTHLGGGEMKSVYETFDPAPLVDLAQAVVAKGYTAVKVVCVPYSEPLMSASYVKKFAQAIERLRRAVGDGVDLMIDFHGRTSPAMAIQYINAVTEFHPFFCEEPVPPENVAALREVRQAVRVPIATGERLVTRHQFREVFEQQACHVIQPDLCHCGGLLEGKKIAAMAEVYYMGVAPHNPLGPVANAAALHFALSTPNFLIQEDMLSDVPWRWDVVRHSLETREGYWLKTEQPGLGVEVNEEEARKHPFQPEAMPTTSIRAADGAILDW